MKVTDLLVLIKIIAWKNLNSLVKNINEVIIMVIQPLVLNFCITQK